MSWKPFAFEVVPLATIDADVISGTGVVYSTNPKRAVGEDSADYFVKGPEVNIVFAELAGCVLANAVGLTVPCAKMCTVGIHKLAGTRLISQFRDIGPWLAHRSKVRNISEVYECIVVDIWLGNTDRNMGNIVVSPCENGYVDFVFIDFEKASALRQYPTTQTAMIAPKDLWPSGELGSRLRSQRPLFPPPNILRRIGDFQPHICRSLIEAVAGALDDVSWANDTIDTLLKRARLIEKLAGEVWN